MSPNNPITPHRQLCDDLKDIHQHAVEQKYKHSITDLIIHLKIIKQKAEAGMYDH